MSKVVGIGGCGRNNVKRMLPSLPSGFDLYTLDQIDDLPYRNPSLQLCRYTMGATEPTVVGTDQAAYEHLLKDDAPLYIVAGLGGGTGTNVSTILAKEAHARGIPVYCLVTTPFAFEGKRNAIAKKALIGLAQYATAILTFSNDLLEKVLGSAVKLETAFSTHGEWVMQALLAVHGLYGQDGNPPTIAG